MNISQIFRLMGGDGADCYKGFRSCAQDRQSIVKEAINQYIPEHHEIMDRSIYEDEIVSYESGVDENDEPIIGSKIVNVSRVPLAIEKDIINRKVTFATGGGVTLEHNYEDDTLFERIENNFYESEMDMLAKDYLKHLLASTQAGVILYSPKVDAPKDFKFKHKLVSPLLGDKLEPFFDEDTGDLIAFGREYEKGSKTRYDLYLINESGFVEIRKYENGKPLLTFGTVFMPNALCEMVESEGQVYDVVVTPYKKLPIIYSEIDQGECADIRILRQEYEKALNGFFEQNKFSASPILFAKGSTFSLPNRDRAGKYIESSDPDGSLEFLTPENATESRELQFKLAENYMYSLCNSMKFDSETFKGAGLTSGEAIERYLTPMYLDAKDKQDGLLSKFYQRLLNWLVFETASFLNQTTELKVYVKFNKLSFTTDKDRIELAQLANGGKAVVSHLQSIQMAGLSFDAEQTLKDIQDENNKIANTVA